MHLYTQSQSPNGRRVNVFMKEKGVDIARTEIDLRKAENLSESYRVKNPFGRVPVLKLDSGAFLSESQAICLYLEGLYPEPNMFGESVEEKAIIEMWNRRVELNVLIPVAQGFRNITGFFKDRETCVPEWGEVSVEAAIASATLFDLHLADNEYITGDQYRICDMTLAIIVDFAKDVGQDLMVGENIRRWHNLVCERAAFQ